MKYAHYNETTRQILGWYDDGVHKEIPIPSVEVEDTVWQNAINNNHSKINEDGTTSLFDFRTEAEKVQQLLEQQRAEALKYLLNTDYIVTKIAEAQALGEDTTSLLNKYAVELQQRKKLEHLLEQIHDDNCK